MLKMSKFVVAGNWQEAGASFANQKEKDGMASVNFPQLPVRTDGPYFVWMGIVRDDTRLSIVDPLFRRGAQELQATRLLREAPETVILEPAPGSRLRWFSAPE
jgi:hypothetical protein